MFWRVLQPFFQWSDNTWVGQAIRDSEYLFPIISVIHLAGLTVLLGAALMFNLRVVGLVMRREPLGVVTRNFGRWILGAFSVMLISGWLMLTSEAAKCFQSGPFQAKMACLLGATLIQFILYRQTIRPAEAKTWHKIAAVLSLTLWFSVGLAGRAIGYL